MRNFVSVLFIFFSILSFAFGAKEECGKHLLNSKKKTTRDLVNSLNNLRRNNSDQIPEYIQGVLYQILDGTPYSSLNSRRDYRLNFVNYLEKFDVTKRRKLIEKELSKSFEIDNQENISGVNLIYDGVFSSFRGSVNKVKEILSDSQLTLDMRDRRIKQFFSKAQGAAFELRVISYQAKNIKSGEKIFVSPKPYDVKTHFLPEGIELVDIKMGVKKLGREVSMLDYSSAEELSKLDSAMSYELADFMKITNKGLVIGETKIGGMLSAPSKLKNVTLKTRRSIMNKILLAKSMRDKGVLVKSVQYCFMKNDDIKDELLVDIWEHGKKFGIEVDFLFVK